MLPTSPLSNMIFWRIHTFDCKYYERTLAFLYFRLCNIIARDNFFFYFNCLIYSKIVCVKVCQSKAPHDKSLHNPNPAYNVLIISNMNGQKCRHRCRRMHMLHMCIRGTLINVRIRASDLTLPWEIVLIYPCSVSSTQRDMYMEKLRVEWKWALVCVRTCDRATKIV